MHKAVTTKQLIKFQSSWDIQNLDVVASIRSDDFA